MAAIQSLPLFPLGLVLYPNEQLPLHIFENRYKALTKYCLDHDVPFGIVLYEDALASVGTTARIERVLNRYDDGRLDLMVQGEQRFRIQEVYDRKSYYTADVTLFGDEAPIEAEGHDLQERVITQHMKLLELAGRTVRPSLYQNVDTLSFVLAQNGGLDNEQKQEVLELTSEQERLAYLSRHFASLIPRVEQQEDVQRRIRSNGHFKDFPPEEV
ncbi:LON peptidase substrate-binding domain-containing protein [Salisaeta longa]|uniref:LON peptidase substrate-binding domain-containing protein n=1 Tax=Salisaeta longa TaxID=503170 RepID=UPI0003B3CAD6|nr:LON peptidase substrate-binding domain-containing protein [Salisaeta longa]